MTPTLFWFMGFLLRDGLVVLWAFLCRVTWSFSLAALYTSSFILTLENLMIMCLGVHLLKKYLSGALCIS